MMSFLIRRVVRRYAASLSDSPEKWKGLTKHFATMHPLKSKNFRGYTLHWIPQRGDHGDFDMAATLEDGQVVAWLYYGPWNDDNTSEDLEGAIEVHPKFRRQGLASAMYQWAEQLSGKKFKPGEGHTNDAEKFWTQKNRPFGH